MLRSGQTKKPAYIPYKDKYVVLRHCNVRNVRFTSHPDIMTRRNITETTMDLSTMKEIEYVDVLPGSKVLDLSEYSILQLLEEIQGRV